MIEIQDYIRKLYEQTGVKLKEDDPILIELVAQQIILEEFNQDIALNYEKTEKKFLNYIQINQKQHIKQNEKLFDSINKKIIYKVNKEQQKFKTNLTYILISYTAINFIFLAFFIFIQICFLEY